MAFEVVDPNMELTLRFFASFREVVGQKTIAREYDDVSTVGDVLEALTAEYPGLELHGEDGSLREYITVMRNGRDVAHVDGLAHVAVRHSAAGVLGL